MARKIRFYYVLLTAGILFILAGGLCTHWGSFTQQIHLRKGESSSNELPFKIQLTDFDIQYHDGTLTPTNFTSRLILIKEDKLIEKQVSCNHPVNFDGFSIIQQGYDKDLQGSILLIRHDSWGAPLVFIGYLLTAIGFIVFLCHQESPFRKLLRQLSFILILFLPIYGFANDLAISTDEANAFSRLSIYYNGRIAPFESYARDYCNSVFPKNHVTRQASCTQTVLDIYLFPEHWPASTPKPLMRIFPQENQWLTPEFNHLGQTSDSLFVGHILDLLKLSICHSDTAQSHYIIQSIRLFQDKRNPSINRQKEKAELVYHQYHFELMASLSLILLALIEFLISFLNKKNPKWRRRGIVLHLIAFVMLIFDLIIRRYISGHSPLGNTHDTMLCLSIGVLIISFFISQKLKSINFLGILFAGLILFSAYLIEGDGFSTLTAILQSPWLNIHVSITMLAYSCFCFTLLLALVSFIFIGLRKNEEELRNCTNMSKILCILGVVFLAFGIMTGSVWAQISWGSYWTWDPKETLALLTLIAYSSTLIGNRFIVKKKSFWYHIGIFLSFLFLLTTYFGVNLWFGGMHSY